MLVFVSVQIWDWEFKSLRRIFSSVANRRLTKKKPKKLSIMCHKYTCRKCSKPSWWGCGRHIDSALCGVPVEDRCACRPRTQEEHDTIGYIRPHCSVM